MYQYALHSMGKMGWILSFILLACGALRLARFNVQSSIGQTNGDFTGLPIPMSAGVIACFVAFLENLDDQQEFKSGLIYELHRLLLTDEIPTLVLGFLAPFLACLMVSNVAYRSHKSLNITIFKPFRLLALLVILIGLMAYKPTLVGFLFFFLYACSGVFELIIGWKKPRNDDEIFQPIKGNSSVMEPHNEQRTEEQD